MQRAHADDAVAIHPVTQTQTTECPTSIWRPAVAIVREQPVEMMPANAPATVTAQRMAEAFHESRSDNLGPADDGVYRTLVGKLRQDRRDV